jgi:hypothetical protein
VGHRELQHVLVRMHVDDAFARAVLSAPHDARTTPELDERDRGHLARLDVRAFLTDPLRRSRLAHAVLLELPVTVATVGMPALFAFFAGTNRHFGAAVRGRGSMALMCAAFFDDEAPGVARIEGALAHARRRAVHDPPPGTLVRARGVNSAQAPAGALAHYADARARLGDDVADAIARGVRIATLAATSAREHVVIERDAVGHAAEGVHALLQLATTPVARAQLEAKALTCGADTPAEAREVIEGLVADGLLSHAGRARV